MMSAVPVTRLLPVPQQPADLARAGRRGRAASRAPAGSPRAPPRSISAPSASPVIRTSRTRAAPMPLPQRRDQRRPVQVGHPEVADHEVDPAAGEAGQRRPAAGDGLDRRARPAADARPPARRSRARRRRPGRGRARGRTRAGAPPAPRQPARAGQRQRDDETGCRGPAALSTAMRPPCAATMPWQTDRPTPVPDALRLGGEERLEDALAGPRAACRARCPRPRSRPSPPGARRAIASRRGGALCTSACCALTIRLVSTWCSWSASPQTCGRPGASSRLTSTPAVRRP